MHTESVWYFGDRAVLWASYINAMIEENRQLVTDELVEFEKEPVEVEDSRKITDHFRGIYRIHSNLVQEKRRLSTYNRLDL